MEGFPETGPVLFSETSQLFNDKSFFDGSKDGLDDGGFEESRFLPLTDCNIPEVICRPHLAGYGHDDDIRSFLVVGV